METERKSRYELFLEEEARKAQPTKRCSKCGEVKVMGDYHKDKGGKFGVHSICKKCVLARVNKYRDRKDWFWKSYWARVVKDGDCLMWNGAHNQIPLCTYGGKQINVRRIVYEFSIGEVPKDMFVVATCRNRRCVKHSHLRLATREDVDVICRNSKATGTRNGAHTHPGRKHAQGERTGAAKCTESDVCAIRRLYAQGECSQREIAQGYGVTPSLISKIVNRKIWTHVDA